MKIISYKKIFNMAFPVTLNQGVILTNGLVDLAFISPFGTDAIAAVAVSNVISVTILNFFEGLRLGTTVLVAKASVEDTQKTAGIFNAGVVLALLSGGLLSLLAPYISSSVFAAIGNPALSYYGTDYFTYWLYAVSLTFILNVLTGLLRGLSDTVTPLYNSILICLVNASLDYLFIYDSGLTLGLGVKGSALATLTATFIGILCLIYAVSRPKTKKFINLQESFFPYSKEYLKLAVQIGMNIGMTNLALLFFMYIIEKLGPAALAVHQITFQIFLFAYLPAMGFLITASILVPQLIGNNERQQLFKTVVKMIKLSLGTVFILSAVLFLLANQLSSFFSPRDTTVAREAAATIRLVCLAMLSCSVYMVLRGTLTGMKDTAFLVYEGLITGYLIFLPLAFLLTSKLNYDVFGGYLAFLIWCISDLIALAVRFYCLNRRNNRIII